MATLGLPAAPSFPDNRVPDNRVPGGRFPGSTARRAESARRPASGAPVLFTWRTPGWQRASCLAWTALAVCAAVMLVASGPGVGVSFGMRLPLTVLACGGTWCAARWRRRVTVTTDEVVVRGLLRTRRISRSQRMCSTAMGTGLFIARAQQPRGPVPMVTPWLALTAVSGVALATAKVLSDHPQFTGAAIAGGAVVCIVATAASLTR